MNQSFFKRVMHLIKNVYVKILPLSFSLGFLFLSIIALSMLNEFAVYISLLLLLFLFFPLLLSIQLLCTRIFAYGEQIDYKEIYKQLKIYFSPIFRGSYKILSAFLFSFVALLIFVSIFEYVVLLNNIELVELVLVNQEAFVMEIINVPYFDYAFTIIVGLTIFVFLWRIFSKITYPYFSYFCGLQRRFLRRFLSYIKHNKIYPYKKRMFTIGFPFALIYLISYMVSSSVSYYFSRNMDISILIGLLVSILLCSLYLPIYIKGCHLIVAELKPIGTDFLKEEIKKEFDFVDNNPSLSEEEKQAFKEKYKNLQEMLDKNKNQTENEKKED